MPYNLSMDINWQGLVNSYKLFTPDPLFLMIATGFLGVIMAFLIPMSIEIISKVSTKYNSDVIVRLFQSNIIGKLFPYFVLLNIAAMLVMRFFYGSEFYNSLLSKGIMWLLLVFSVLITILIGYLIYRIEKLISDDSVPFKMLIQKMKQSLKSQANRSKQDLLIQSIEGIGDILFFQTRKQNNLLVIKGLEEMCKSITYLMQLKITQANKFEHLVYSEEYIEYLTENSEYSEAMASFVFSNPDKHLAGIAYPLNQIERVYLSALANNNRQIAYLSLKYIADSMHAIATTTDNHIILELFVKKLSDCLRTAVKRNAELSGVLSGWFIESVFKEPHSGSNSFDISYLDIYDRYFLTNMQYIINEDKDDYFRAAITYMAKHFHYPDYQREKLWGYNYLLRSTNFEKYLSINREHRVQRKVRALIDAENQMYTTAQLKSWLEYFDKLKNIISPHLNEAIIKRKAAELEELIRDNATKHLKYTRLIRLTYAIGTLCEIKHKHSYIRYMWETVQENIESESGLTLIPQTLQAVINDYLIFHDISERHKLPGNNYRRYVLMLVSSLLTNTARKQFYLPNIYPEQFAICINGIKGLETTMEIMEQSAQEEAIRIGEQRSKNETTATKELSIFIHKLHNDLNKLISKNRRRTSLNPKITESFQKAFLEKFASQRVIKEIFDKYLQLYENQTRSKYTKLMYKPWGITELVTKAVFMEQKDSAKRSGLQYGQSLADIENMTLFDNIMKHCKRSSPYRFEQSLRNAGEARDLLILSTYGGMEKFLSKEDRFHAARYIQYDILGSITKDNNKDKSSEEDLTLINGFVGYYDINSYPIPVFNFYYRGIGNHLLILHKKKLGKLVQMPLMESSAKNKKRASLNSTVKLTAGIMQFNLAELSKSSKLLKGYIEDSPAWLKKIGDIKQQKEYLMERVLITALENLAYTMPNKKQSSSAKSFKTQFIGYKINVGEIDSPEEATSYNLA